MDMEISVNGRVIGQGRPAFIVAELSANHNGDLGRARRLIAEAAAAGADAVKVQTYTADCLTIDADSDPFRIRGTAWDGMNLYRLYRDAAMDWEWHIPLKEEAEKHGLVFFSTPFSARGVDFLEREVGPPLYKVASFEMVDLPFLKLVADTGKPVVMSCGTATVSEIDEAVSALRAAGCPGVLLLHCVSSYPAEPEDMNLLTIPNMAATFGCPAGLSDHSLGAAAAVAAVVLGAVMVEKHLCLSRTDGGPDSGFSMEPDEFAAMVDSVRRAEASLGRVCYGSEESPGRAFRRSLFVVEDMREGEEFNSANLRSIRPGHGLPPKFYDLVVGRRASRDIRRGTPLAWDMVA